MFFFKSSHSFLVSKMMNQYMSVLLVFIAFSHVTTIIWTLFKFPVDSEDFLAQTNSVVWMKDRYRYYFRHLYFVVTTCTTIGYGDITPNKDRSSELVFGILVMLAGLSIMSIVINLSQILLSKFNDQSLKLHRRMKDFNFWFGTIERTSRAEFPQRYVNHLREFLKALYNLEVDTVVYSKFLDQMPPHYSEELEERYHKSHESPFEDIFDAYGKEMTVDIIKGCQPCSFLGGTIILHRGKLSPGIYWITYGKVIVTYLSDNEPVQELEEGDSFGSFCLLEEQSRFNYVAKNTCMAHFLPLDKLKMIIEKNGNSGIAYKEQIETDFLSIQSQKTVVKGVSRLRRFF